MGRVPLDLKPGDIIAIKAKGITVRGTILSACYYGPEDGWYIELINANVPGGYSYWKQGLDGGKIVEVNGRHIG